MRHRGRRVRSGSFGSFGSAPAVVGFIRVRLGSSGRISGVVGFIRVRPFGSAPGDVGFIRCVVWFVRARHGSRWVHSSSFCSLVRDTGVVGIILVRLVHFRAPRRTSGSFVCVWFIRAHPGDFRVHSCSLGSFWRAPSVVGFIQVLRFWGRRINSGAPLV